MCNTEWNCKAPTLSNSAVPKLILLNSAYLCLSRSQYFQIHPATKCCYFTSSFSKFQPLPGNQFLCTVESSFKFSASTSFKNLLVLRHFANVPSIRLSLPPSLLLNPFSLEHCDLQAKSAVNEQADGQ